MLHYLTYLEKWPKRTLVAFMLAQIMLFGVIDLVTGPEVSLSIFYLIPIATAAWLAGLRAGMVASFEAAIFWFLADILAGHTYSHPTIPFWNTLVRLGFFVIVTYSLSEIHRIREREEELRNFIVHDLRSPLGTVMTGTQTLREISAGSLSLEQIELIDLCMVSCNRMLVLINSILDLARLQSGKMPLQQETIALEPLFKTTVESIYPWAKQRDVTLSWFLSPGIESVFADPVITERILINLVSNAVKFSAQDSEVTIQATRYEAGLVAVNVIDHGKGIRREDAERIFGKFAQGETNNIKSGSGLGLAFCQLAVEAQGGRIWINSQPGQGSIVTFTLPGGEIVSEPSS